MSIRDWLRNVWPRRHDDEDLQDEIQAHLAMAARERMADGADPDAARQAALREFGNVTLTRDAVRRVWIPRWLDGVLDMVRDVRYATRSLARHKAFAVTIVFVLTLGIGVNATVFTMLKGMLLSPIPGVDGATGLNVIFGETGTGRDLALSFPDYEYLRDHNSAFTGLFGYRAMKATLGRGQGARPIWGEFASANYFDVLGIRAELGRTLQASDERAPGQSPVVVISDGLWRRDFGADPDIIGETIELNNVLLTVVGVVAPPFRGTTVVYDVEVYVPVMMGPALGLTFGSTASSPADVLADRNASVLYGMGRLRPGATRAQAAEQNAAIWAQLSADRPPAAVVQRLQVVPFWRAPGSAQATMLPLLVVLSVMGLFVLMVACANIAGLVIVRGISRRGEIALRLAIGASRARIVRLLIVENLVLAVPGALFGVLLASRAIPWLVGRAQALAAPERLFINIGTDTLVMSFAVLVAVGCAFLFGFLPALRSSKVDLVAVINDESPRGVSRSTFRSSLVVAQVAVSLLLLIGAGLVTRSLEAARVADRGYDASHVTAVTMDVKANAYDEARGRDFYRRLLDAARATPGVEAATLATYTPLTFLDTRAERVAIDGYQAQDDEDLSMLSNVVAPDYFRTLRIPVVAGREFADSDDPPAAPVAIVNATLADRFWGGAAGALGKRLRIGAEDWRTVVGVVADVKYARVDEAPRPYIYLPFLQAYRSGMTLHSRGTAAMDTLVARAREAVTTLDPDLPVVKAASLEQATRGALIFFQLAAMMLFIFGAAGLTMAGMGTYGLVAYTVRQHTREIGIRLALGAPGSTVVREFVWRGLRLGMAGAGLGAATGLGVSQFLAGVLFGVSATDGRSFATALAVVLGGVVVATMVPAWRAARTDPLQALRHQ